MKKLLSLLPALFLAAFLHAQSIPGTWQTTDDETGEAKGHMQLYEQNGKLYGKVVRLLKSAPDKRCDKCPGERKNQPVLNMVVLENMELKDGYYQAGRILDPEKGKWYNCKVWLQEGDPNTLVVRGSVGPFYRTQYWKRVK